jgi:glycogen synthase
MARIIWITERHSPDSGGMAISSTRLVNTLRDRGHTLTLLHLSGRSSGDDAAPFRLQDTEGHWQAEGWQGELERLFFLKRRALEGCLLIGFGGGIPGYLASLWGKWLGTPSVAMCRGNDLDRLTHDANRGWMVHQTLQQADLVCAVSKEMRSRIAGMRQGPVLFTPVGINPDEWHAFPSDHAAAVGLRARHTPDGRPLVGLFGQLKYKKGLTTAIEVFRNYGLGKYARFLTVGAVPGDEMSELEESCRAFWSAEPYVPRRSLLPFYLACDIVLIPSLYDGMPNVLLEAMMCGVPVVAGRAGGMPDVISHGVDGFLFDAGDAVGATDTLARVLSFVPDARRRIGEAGRIKVSTGFTHIHEADILESALLQLSGA